jgi:tetratricopeptide (TPR) repeat protein
MIGPLVLLVAAGAMLARRIPHAGPPAVVVVLITLVVLTGRQAKVFESRFALFDDNVRRYPDSWMAQKALGDVYLDRGDTNAAIERYQLSIALDDGQSDTYLNLAKALGSQHRLSEAIDAARAATERAHDDPRPFYQLGNALMARGDPTAACEPYARAVEIDPHYAEAYHNWGVALAANHHWDQAIEKYQKADELDPTLPSGKTNLAGALFHGGRYAEALQIYQALASRGQLPPEYASRIKTAETIVELKARLTDHPGDTDLAQRLRDAETAAASMTD